MKKSIIVVAAALVVSGCEGLREAMTAHVDVVARAGAQELSVTRLAELLGRSELPLRREVAEGVADLWVDYHLLAVAASRGDSLNDPRLIDEAMWAEIESARAQQFMQGVAKDWSSPTPPSEAQYNQGDLLAAQHILISTPPTALSGAARDSVRRIAEGIRARVTSGNFAALARQHSQDPGSAQRGGDLGVFPRGTMVPEFERALVALRPGEISPVVQSQFGYHIIRRPTYDQVREQFEAAFGQRYAQTAESTYMAALESKAGVKVRPNAPALVKAVAKDPAAHRRDRAVLATWEGGELTARRMGQWLTTFPPQARVSEQLQSAPDSVVRMFVQSVVRNELVIGQADSAKVEVDSAELTGIRGAFAGAIVGAWTQLGIAPSQLQDSASTEAALLRLASARIEDYLERLVANEARFVSIPPQVQAALQEKYDFKINAAGVDRALERATSIRASADSARAAQQPRSQVPMPTPQQSAPPQSPPSPQGGQPRP